MAFPIFNLMKHPAQNFKCHKINLFHKSSTIILLAVCSLYSLMLQILYLHDEGKPFYLYLVVNFKTDLNLAKTMIVKDILVTMHY